MADRFLPNIRFYLIFIKGMLKLPFQSISILVFAFHPGNFWIHSTLKKIINLEHFRTLLCNRMNPFQQGLTHQTNLDQYPFRPGIFRRRLSCQPEVIAAARRKAQPMQPLFVGEVTHASYQPCSQSLYSLKMVDICKEVWRTGWHTIFEVRTH